MSGVGKMPAVSGSLVSEILHSMSGWQKPSLCSSNDLLLLLSNLVLTFHFSPSPSNFPPYSAHMRQALFLSALPLHQDIHACAHKHKDTHTQKPLYICLRQVSPILLLESYVPVGFHSNPNRVHLILIISWMINWIRLYNWGRSENLQEGISPGTGLGSPALCVPLHCLVKYTRLDTDANTFQQKTF